MDLSKSGSFIEISMHYAVAVDPNLGLRYYGKAEGQCSLSPLQSITKKCSWPVTSLRRPSCKMAATRAVRSLNNCVNGA